MGFVLCLFIRYILFDDVVNEAEHCNECFTVLVPLLAPMDCAREVPISNYGWDTCLQTEAVHSFPHYVPASGWYQLQLPFSSFPLGFSFIILPPDAIESQTRIASLS